MSRCIDQSQVIRIPIKVLEINIQESGICAITRGHNSCTAPTLYPTLSRAVSVNDSIKLPVGTDGIHRIEYGVSVGLTAAPSKGEEDTPTSTPPLTGGRCGRGKKESLMGIQAQTADDLLCHTSPAGASLKSPLVFL